jgi:TRAP-type mannitol/chloroaromatic compound transport system permease large subunit
MPAIPEAELRALRGPGMAGRVSRRCSRRWLLMVAVLGSIMIGWATPTEAASVGAVGAMLLAASQGQLRLPVLREVVRNTTQVTSMVFLILIGASVFSLVFRGFGGDDLVAELLGDLPGGVVGAMLVVMLVMFLLGFVLDFIEITFVVVPIVGPILLAMGLDPVWLGIMIAINLQTSFLTPPFGFALFYLRGVAPPEVRTADIYRGAIPFIAIQLLMLGCSRCGRSSRRGCRGWCTARKGQRLARIEGSSISPGASPGSTASRVRIALMSARCLLVSSSSSIRSSSRFLAPKMAKGTKNQMPARAATARKPSTPI